MKKISRFIFSMTLACCPVALFAQTDAQMKEINKIKLDPAYVFAESTMENPDEARETVCLTLSNFMNEYLEESGESRRVAAAELGAIKYINGKRGNASYVFGYIPVSAFASSAPAPAPAVAETKPATPAPAVAESKPAAPAPEKGERETAATSESSDEDLSIGLLALSYLFGNVFYEGMICDDFDEIEYHADLSDSEQLADMISELLESPDSRKAAYLLNVYKTTGKIRGYGALPTCRDAAASHWLIIDKNGSIVALLGPGADDNRHNYVSGETGHLADYGGKYAVWFTPRAR